MRFAKVPEKIINGELSDRAIVIYNRLALLVDFGTREWRFYGTRQEMADRLHVNVRKLDRALAELREAGVCVTVSARSMLVSLTDEAAPVEADESVEPTGHICQSVRTNLVTQADTSVPHTLYTDLSPEILSEAGSQRAAGSDLQEKNKGYTAEQLLSGEADRQRPDREATAVVDSVIEVFTLHSLRRPKSITEEMRRAVRLALRDRGLRTVSEALLGMAKAGHVSAPGAAICNAMNSVDYWAGIGKGHNPTRQPLRTTEAPCPTPIPEATGMVGVYLRRLTSAVAQTATSLSPETPMTAKSA